MKNQPLQIGLSTMQVVLRWPSAAALASADTRRSGGRFSDDDVIALAARLSGLTASSLRQLSAEDQAALRHGVEAQLARALSAKLMAAADRQYSKRGAAYAPR